MNDAVDVLNTALQNAVARAGSSVHFVNYDSLLDIDGSRFCQPGMDESGGKSASRDEIFFYEMKSLDDPWTVVEDQWPPHDELKLKTRDDDYVQPVNDTLNAVIGAMVQEGIESQNNTAVVEDDNANDDLEAEVADDEELTTLTGIFVRDADSVPAKGHSPAHVHGVRIRDLNSTLSWNITNTTTAGFYSNGSIATNVTLLGTTVRTLLFNNSTRNSTTVTGTIIGNHTHILLSNANVVSKSAILKLLVSDKTGRVFHPTQGGHALIANTILYYMAAQNAAANGKHSILSALA